MTDPAAIDLEATKAALIRARQGCYIPVAVAHEIDALIAAVKALRERVAELEPYKALFERRNRAGHNSGIAETLMQRAEAAEAHATELAGALGDIIPRFERCMISSGTEVEYASLATVKARVVLTSTPAKALEWAKARDEVVKAARIYSGVHLMSTGGIREALSKLDALDQGDAGA